MIFTLPELLEIEDMTMKDYRVTWQQCPHIRHDQHVLFIEANSEEDARRIARDYVERRFAIEWFSIHAVEETPPPPIGRWRRIDASASKLDDLEHKVDELRKK